MEKEKGNVVLVGLVMLAMVALAGGGLFLYFNLSKPASVVNTVAPKTVNDLPKDKPDSKIIATASAAPSIETVFGLSTNWQKLIIKFISSRFDEIASFDYTLTYAAAGTDSARLVKGKIVPDLETVAGNISGKPYFLREIILGSCSQNVCVYDISPSNFKVTTSIKLF